MVDIHGSYDERFIAVKEAFERNFEEDLEVGASLAITHKGNLVLDIYGGYMDKAKTRSWERETIINVYSTTKVMGSLCIHILVDRGLIDLDAPISKYWPEFAQAGKESMPVRYILSHTTGIPRFDEKITVQDLYNWDKMTHMIASQKPWWKPGTRSGYQSITFSFLAGELIRRVLERSGNKSKTIGEFFKNEVAEPLDIDFHIGLDARYDDRVAELVDTRENVPNWVKFMLNVLMPRKAKVLFNPPPSELMKHSQTREWRAAELASSNGHGNARSIARVGALLACGGMLDGKQILSRSAVENSLVEQIYNKDLISIGPQKVRWGLGWALEFPDEQRQTDLALGSRSFHWGGWGGSKCIMDYDKQVSLGYAMNKMGPTLGKDVRIPRIIKPLKKILQEIS
jgi:CubicO group peptidase (beta-lactamase class C family)